MTETQEPEAPEPKPEHRDTGDRDRVIKPDDYDESEEPKDD